MKDKVLITGFNGTIAKNLYTRLDLSKYTICFLTSDKKKCSKNIFYWDIQAGYIDKEALKDVVHIIHLAGFNIASKWSAKNKLKMYDSRVNSSKLLYEKCVDLNIHPKTFISASAMGYYGFNKNGIKKEKDKTGDDWMAKLCEKWEKAADNFKLIKTRVVKTRLALVVDKNSGVLQKTILGFKFKTGIIFVDGKQCFPWIDIIDAVRFIKFTLKEKNIDGVFNLASPQKISYYTFIKSVQKIKYKYSILISIPKLIFQLILPEKYVLLFNDIQLSTEKIEATGFKWEYPNIEKSIAKNLI